MPDVGVQMDGFSLVYHGFDTPVGRFSVMVDEL